MNTRFPFGLKPQDAQRIIDVACSTWKKDLASEWSENIVLSKTTSISEDFYEEMRAACTKEQHILFDEIFGNDVDFSILNDTDVFYLKTKKRQAFLFRGCDPFCRNTEFYCLEYKYTGKNKLCGRENVAQLRLANEDELKIWEEHYPSQKIKIGDYIITSNYCDMYDGRVLKVTEIQNKKYAYFNVLDGGSYNKENNFYIKWTNFRLATQEEIDAAMCPYKDGELIFVRQSLQSAWYLRYSSGRMSGDKAVCYNHQFNHGFKGLWNHHAPTPKGFKLPE